MSALDLEENHSCKNNMPSKYFSNDNSCDEIEICAETVNPGVKMSMSDFDILQVIGKGGYGKVFLVRKTSLGSDYNKLFAMKVLKKAVICRTEKDMIHTWSERNILKMIRHPFLVKLHYAFQNESNLSMILEYCPGGELYTYLESVGFLNENDACFYISEISLALGHLHMCGVIYRDLKPENVLLDIDGHCKLADFGLSKDNSEKTNTYCGTKEYMAPEIWLKNYHDKNVDWWCLGNLLYDMLAGYPPFICDDNVALREKILYDKVEYSETFSEDVISILNGLLTKDPTKRLGYGPHDHKLIQLHPFFKRHNIVWDDVYHKRLKPPYRPCLQSETDTELFDPIFTSLSPVLSPVDPVNGNYFEGFSYGGSVLHENSNIVSSSLTNGLNQTLEERKSRRRIHALNLHRSSPLIQKENLPIDSCTYLSPSNNNYDLGEEIFTHNDDADCMENLLIGDDDECESVNNTTSSKEASKNCVLPGTLHLPVLTEPDGIAIFLPEKSKSMHSALSRNYSQPNCLNAETCLTKMNNIEFNYAHNCISSLQDLSSPKLSPHPTSSIPNHNFCTSDHHFSTNSTKSTVTGRHLQEPTNCLLAKQKQDKCLLM